MPERTAIIIGAGPAGLTAAYELITRSDIKPIVLEKSDCMGGIARTVDYKGYRLDIGPHRFFSKSDRVMDWWLNMLPLAAGDGTDQQITYQQKSRSIPTSQSGADPRNEDRVMLMIQRKTRIYYLRRLFDYPISLNFGTLSNLGPIRTVRIGCSYLKAAAFPIKPEVNLEQFLINRFGKELYLTFFKDYTEKVWGIACDKISAEWGAQRIKGLNVTKAITHALKKILSQTRDLKQKGTETSLVEQFLFPKLGAGQMWEVVSGKVKENGGEIIINTKVTRINVKDNQVTAIETVNALTGEKKSFSGDFFFSTMPMKELVEDLSCDVPQDVREIADGLVYRDFVQVGVLVDRMRITEKTEQGLDRPISDNWIYIQESDVKVGRVEIWNNWGGGMVKDPSKIWLGLEYFCNEGDEIWNLTDEAMIKLAVEELDKIGIAGKDSVLDATVIRMPKTYPGYFGTYDRFDDLRAYLDKIENLFLVGRNGQHKYNNQDHSMLAAMTAVDNIVQGVKSKENVWAVNTEMEYHEEKAQV
jgi:protoporphyrinogen oxidase